MGPKRRSPALSGISAGLMDSAPFYRSRCAPNLFRFIALLIHKFLFNLICHHCYGNRAKKGCAARPPPPAKKPLPAKPEVLFLLPFPLIVVSSTHFQPLLRFHDRRLLEKDISRLSLALNAPLRQPSRVPEDDVIFCALRSFRFTKWYFRLRAFANGFFSPDPSGFDVSDMKKSALTGKMSYLRKLFSSINLLYISFIYIRIIFSILSYIFVSNLLSVYCIMKQE